MKFLRFLPVLLMPAYFFSCTPQQKIPFYLENVSDTNIAKEVKTPELVIQKKDLLSVTVYSISTDPRSDAPYNLPAGASGQGFLVDDEGNIQYPQIGSVPAAGLTKKQLAAEIKKRLTEPVELLRDPTVIIRFMNFKVTVLGEVGREGVLEVPGERVTILEAIGLVGGITTTGKKDNVRIIREINGKRETAVLNLSSNEIFESPYYHLVQNDLILVEPTKQKLRDTDQARIAQKISFAFTLVTAAATIANIFLRN